MTSCASALTPGHADMRSACSRRSSYRRRFVQFSDGLPAGPDPGHDTLHRRALPGDGEFDLAGFTARLRANGFRGPVSVEVLSDDLRALPVEEFARRTMETSLPYWQ
jgi:sugar phosphate isomerase/epimerase